MLKQVSDDLYQVDSKTNPDSSHFITLENGVWVCDCVGFKFRQSCRHVKEVLAVVEK